MHQICPNLRYKVLGHRLISATKCCFPTKATPNGFQNSSFIPGSQLVDRYAPQSDNNIYLRGCKFENNTWSGVFSNRPEYRHVVSIYANFSVVSAGNVINIDVEERRKKKRPLWYPSRNVFGI
ncbi:hypothetical protein TNIN_186501 [Trichonephila inaurata madagascariensis]|uniref:Uncharacterized protein n=1 Tax=Trichonephila inaurata madagascariensis TaxID=2747483 RepID=A0A8X6K2L3_9ARAC|nr:hypothetical protein TNIN_186501 [Trichonephila inaurata madagascariensis]